MTYALRPSIGPINRPPPWRRHGFHSFQGMGSYTESPGFHYEYATAGLGAGDEATTSKSVRELQQILLSKGFSVGSAGADNLWGTNTRNALERALGRDASAYAPAARATTVALPTSWWFALAALPDRPVSGGSSSGGSTSTSSGGGTTIGPNTLPEGEDELLGSGGSQWSQIWPWAAGATALVALGGAFLLMGKKRRGGGMAAPAPVTANRRRLRRRGSRRRGSQSQIDELLHGRRRTTKRDGRGRFSRR